MKRRLASARPLVYVITDGSLTQENYSQAHLRILELVRRAVASGIQLFQIRERSISSRLVFELASAAAAITSASETKLLINDRADIAVAAGADGVHLTSRSMSPRVVRAAFGDNILIGASTHTIADILAAAENDVDLVLFGPVFETPGKGRPTGLNELVRAVGAAGEMPLLGLGGVDDSNFRSVLDAGAAGIAAIRFLNDPKNFKLFN